MLRPYVVAKLDSVPHHLLAANLASSQFFLPGVLHRFKQQEAIFMPAFHMCCHGSHGVEWRQIWTLLAGVQAPIDRGVLALAPARATLVCFTIGTCSSSIKIRIFFIKRSHGFNTVFISGLPLFRLLGGGGPLPLRVPLALVEVLLVQRHRVVQHRSVGTQVALGDADLPLSVLERLPEGHLGQPVLPPHVREHVAEPPRGLSANGALEVRRQRVRPPLLRRLLQAAARAELLQVVLGGHEVPGADVAVGVVHPPEEGHPADAAGVQAHVVHHAGEK